MEKSNTISKMKSYKSYGGRHLIDFFSVSRTSPGFPSEGREANHFGYLMLIGFRQWKPKEERNGESSLWLAGLRSSTNDVTTLEMIEFVLVPPFPPDFYSSSTLSHTSSRVDEIALSRNRPPCPISTSLCAAVVMLC